MARMIAQYTNCTPRGTLERARTWLRAAAELLEELTDEDRQHIEHNADPRTTRSLSELKITYQL